MGFSSIISQIVLVFTMIGIIALVILTYRDYITDTNIAMKMQEQKIAEKINTNIWLNNLTYNNSKINVTVKNIGSTTLKPSEVDIFVDKTRIPRSTDNRTMSILNDIVNPGLWDPAEKLFITISKTLSTGTHRVEVITHQGIRSAEIIEVS